MKIRTILFTLALAVSGFAFAACGGDDEGGSSGSGNNTSGGNNSTSGGSSTCETQHQCLNGACECTTSGAEGTACCDPDDCGDDADNCTDKCRVCS